MAYALSSYNSHIQCTVGVTKKFPFRFVYRSVLLPFLRAAFKVLPFFTVFVTVSFTVSTLLLIAVFMKAVGLQSLKLSSLPYEAFSSLLIISWRLK